MKPLIELFLNLPDLRILDCVISDTEVHIFCESTKKTGICPSCQKETSEVRMYQEREIQDMMISGRKVYLNLKTRQFHCKDCSRFFNEMFDFVDKSGTMTKRYEKYIYFMLENICVNQVCIKEDITWATAQRLYEKYADKKLAVRKVWDKVRYLGIDEISIKKGHKNYACVLVDLETGVMLDFLENREKKTIEAYFKKKGVDFCNQIKVVSSDMWDAYSTLAGKLFPNAISVIDRYHFFAHLNKALDKSRKMLRKKFPTEEIFKRLRWTLLKNPAHLSTEETQILDKVFLLSPELEQVYQLRKELKDIFDMDISKEAAAQKVEIWEEKACKSEAKPIHIFVKILHNWKDKILNFFHQRHTNAIVEGINNAIRGIIRRSFGFQNFENLKRRILTELG